MKLTVVSTALVVVGTKVLAEMSDGSVVELSCPWGSPKESDIDHYWSPGWKNKTSAELVALAQSHNCLRKVECQYSGHMDKVRRLGHDFAARGY